MRATPPLLWPPNRREVTNSKRRFGTHKLHFEFRLPYEPKARGQGRGNSGVYLMTKYEVQVLDSYQNDTYADGQAAGSRDDADGAVRNDNAGFMIGMLNSNKHGFQGDIAEVSGSESRSELTNTSQGRVRTA